MIVFGTNYGWAVLPVSCTILIVFFSDIIDPGWSLWSNVNGVNKTLVTYKFDESITERNCGFSLKIKLRLGISLIAITPSPFPFILVTLNNSDIFFLLLDKNASC